MAEDDTTATPPRDGPREAPAGGAAGASLRRSRPGRLRRMRDPREWRVRTKLVAVLAIPTAAFLVLAGLNLTTLVLDARAYEADARTAQLGRDVATLTHELQRERDLTAGYYYEDDEPATRRLAAQRRAVDDAVERYRTHAPAVREDASGPLSRTLDAVARDLSALPRLRDAVDERTVTQAAAVDEYASDVTHLVDVVGSVTGSGDAELTQRLRALVAFAEAKERASETRGVVFALSLQGRLGGGEDAELTTALANERAAAQRFRESANDAQRALVSRTVRGQALLTVSRLEEEALRGGGRSLDVDPEQWLAASTTRQQQMAQAEDLLLDRVVTRTGDLSTGAQQKAVITGSMIVAVLVLSLLLSLGVARSMARQLSSLRRGALDVAQVQLPEGVARIRETPPGVDPEEEVPSLNLHSRDEVGQVAAAFDAVHRQAVRLAGEQALLRRDVNTLFVNFSRRSQSLVERQLSLIDDLEAREQDPSVLENLFRLDHLATRMRRNNESLLVIAGSDTTRRWTRPVSLPDVVLAAVSEIEQFTRVEQHTGADVAVAGHAVSDIVHLLAELLENATRSSPPSTNVTVSGRAVRGGTEALLEIEDSGIGMTKEALREANRRLGDPGGTVPSGPRMGLFVVSRLARRYGILVDLAESPHGGVVAQVRLPSSLVTTGSVQDSGRADVQGGGRVAPALPADAPRGEAARPARDGHQQDGPRDDDEQVGRRDDGRQEDGTGHDRHRGDHAAGDRTVTYDRSAPVVRHNDVSTVVLPVFDSVSEWFRDQPHDDAGDAEDAAESVAPGEPADGVDAAAPTDHGTAAWSPASAPTWDARSSERTGAPVSSPPGHDGARPHAGYETGPGGLPRRPAGARAASADGGRSASWASTGDAGWAAAEEAATPTSAGTTSAGLPIRRPMAHFVPGASDSPRANDDALVPAGGNGATPRPGRGGASSGQSDGGAPRTPPTERAGAEPPAVPDTAPHPLRTADAPGLARPEGAATSPDQVRGLLSRYYRGVREARQASGTTTTEGPAPGSPSPSRGSEYDTNAHEGEST